MNTWCIGYLVRVGSGAVVWRIESFTDSADGTTLAHLERVGRADVHTTVSTDRLKEAV